MKRVEFYVLKGTSDILAGSILWDGRSFTCQPFQEWLREILAEPLYDPEAQVPVTARHNPERWLECLQYTYRSWALRASKVLDGET